MKSDAYIDGAWAYRNFKHNAVNPYDVDKNWEEYLEWESGWFDACLEEELD